MEMKWKRRYLLLAFHVSTWSRDPSTKVGAVIVDDDKHVVATGYNGFPRGVDDSDERYNDRPTKYSLVAHAELNAVLQAGHRAKGATLFCTLFPCGECAKAIIQSGIKHVVSHTGNLDRWADHHRLARQMFDEARVTWELLDERISSV